MTLKTVGLKIVCLMLAAFLLFPSAYTASAQDIDTSSTGTGWITDPELIPRGPLLARTSDVKSTSGNIWLFKMNC